MATDPVVSNARGPFLTLDIDAALALLPGDLVYYDTSTNELKKADASAVATYAQWLVVTGGTGGVGAGTALVAQGGIVYDADAPYTAGAAQYLSATAGEITATRPTTAGDLIQRVGYAVTGSRLSIDIHSPYEVAGPVQEALLEDTAARLLVDTNGPAAGVTLAAPADDVTWAFPIPENAVGIASGWMNMSCNVALDATDTMSYAISSSHDGEDNEVVADAITTIGQVIAQYATGRKDLSGGLDVAGIVKPSGILHIKVTKVAEGTAGDDMVVYPPLLMWLCV